MPDTSKEKRNFNKWLEQCIYMSDEHISVPKLIYDATMIHPVGELTVKRRLDLMERAGLIVWNKAEETITRKATKDKV